MGLEFVLAASGRGKTTKIHKMILDEAMKFPDKKIFLVVPEQYTLENQRDLVNKSKSNGILNIEVQSINRLAFRVLEEIGASKISMIDDLGKLLIIKKLMMDRKDELEYFGNYIDKIGYIEEIKSFISELMQYFIDEDSLDDMIKLVGSKQILAKKLRDVKIAYKAFLEYKEDNYITSEDLISMFANRLSESELLDGASLYFDGFTGFTPVQYNLIRALLRKVDRAVFAVNLDKNTSSVRMEEKYKLFYLSQHTIKSLRDIAGEEGVEILDDIRLDEDISKSRFKDSPDLDDLEKKIFRYPIKASDFEAKNISINVLGQPEKEIKFVVEKIMELRREEGFHYRDLAIVTGDMESYGMIINREFEKANIPVFLDQKKFIIVHPFIEYLLNILNIVCLNYKFDMVLEYVKSEYSDFEKEDVYLLENYLIASGIRGRKKWESHFNIGPIFRKKDELLREEIEGKVNGIRELVSGKLNKFYEEIGGGKKTVREFCTGIVNILEEGNYYKKLKKKAEILEKKGLISKARESGAVYEAVLLVLDRMVELLGDEVISLKDYFKLFQTGLNEVTIGMIPPSMDQVVVGDFNRTRLGKIKYLFFVGTNDGKVPQLVSTGGILSDSEREFFSKNDYALAPTAREQIYTGQFYLYMSLAKASKHLYITYSAADIEGNACLPSYMIERIKGIFPGLKETKPEGILSNDLGKDYMIGCLRSFRIDDDKFREIYKNWHEKNEDLTRKLVEAAYHIEAESRLNKLVAQRLYKEVIVGSASRFEAYSRCPFSYFLKYGLDLQKRKEHELEVFDVGSVVHNALDIFSRRLKKMGKKWGELTEDEELKIADMCMEEVINSYKDAYFKENATNGYMAKNMTELLHRTVWAVGEQLKQGDFEIFDTEFKFELEKDLIKINGIVDRIDTYESDDEILLRIVDYKTGKKDVSLPQFYAGLQMQLLIYLKEGVKEFNKNKAKKIVVPAGIYYYHVTDPVLKVNDSDELEKDEIDNAILKELRMKGLTNEDDEIIISVDKNMDGGDGKLAESKKSKVVEIETKKDGVFTQNSINKLLNEEGFDLLLDYTDYKLDEIAGKIREGDVRVFPYNEEKNKGDKPGVCTYCDYKDVCHFDSRLPGLKENKIKGMSDEEVLENIRKDLRRDKE